MKEKNTNYYMIRIRDKETDNSIDDLEGIIIDVISTNHLNTHRYYLSFLDENQTKHNFYRIKSIKSFLSLLMENGYVYSIEPTNEEILEQISLMNSEEYHNKITKAFIKLNSDNRAQTIYDYLSSSLESYTVDQSTENNISNIIERKNK